MSFNVQQLPNEPIIIYSLYEDFDAPTEMQEAESAVIALLDAADGPMFVIIDIQTNLDFGDLLVGINRGGAGQNPLFTHPNVWEPISISDSPTIKAIAQGLANDAFGNVKNPVFGTFDEAINYIRSQY